ncbi:MULTISPECIES: hypothetical protein [Acinetobacter]|uniref:hypothetical protein n=1 Tax=Acinetobacter TaxID=469 RepID=UPI0002AE8EBA|nr:MULTISPECIES: hypothetical protein [Acinetobacter]ELW85724.1 hypothetical protein ACINWC743_A0748 [Acinetobacter sp. WC-743]MBJ8427826.1 hypothetical protein [Acinetobacter bereziniae]
MIDAVLGKFYKYIILVLMIFIFGYAFYANSLAGKLSNAEKVKTKAVADAIKPYQDAIDQAQEEKATIMQTWSAKIIEVEQNAIKQIQAANIDARNAQFSADSMSKQLIEANKRLSSAPKQTIINYTIASSELLESCTTEYREMAKIADGHAIDVRRLNESWPELNKTLN